MPGKLGMTTTQRMAVLRNQASNLLWYGRIETTLGRAKELRPYVEKIITLAMNTFEDVVETTVTSTDKKGKEVTTKMYKDGAKKLAARRKIMSLTYDIQEQRYLLLYVPFAYRGSLYHQKGLYWDLLY